MCDKQQAHSRSIESADGISWASAWARPGSPRALTKRSDADSGPTARRRPDSQPASCRQVTLGTGASRGRGKQADDLICQRGLCGRSIFLMKSIECMAQHVRDMPGQGGVRLGGVDLFPDDAGGVGMETEKPRVQVGGDKPLVRSERKVIVVAGHADATRVTRVRPRWTIIRRVRRRGVISTSTESRTPLDSPRAK